MDGNVKGLIVVDKPKTHSEWTRALEDACRRRGHRGCAGFDAFCGECEREVGPNPEPNWLQKMFRQNDHDMKKRGYGSSLPTTDFLWRRLELACRSHHTCESHNAYKTEYCQRCQLEAGVDCSTSVHCRRDGWWYRRGDDSVGPFPNKEIATAASMMDYSEKDASPLAD